MPNKLIQRAKGVRDFAPAEAIKRQKIIDLLRSNFELYGFNPIETPILERYDLFVSKFGQGEESDSMKETFKLTDQGGRSLVLRNEFTMPLARFIAMNPKLRLPFKRYQIGQVFRDGPIKFGRYREFWQCDCDVIGNEKVSADAELLLLAQKIFNDLNLEVEIIINNRKLLNYILNKFSVQESFQTEIIICIDKLEKIGENGVIKEIKKKGIKTENIKKILEFLNVTGENDKIITEMKKQIGDCEGLKEIETTLSLLPSGSNIKFVPSLARGLAYYTGNVYEIFLKNKKQLSSALGGGGRYDKMIGGLIGKKESIPAVGISFGLDTIMDALNVNQKKIVQKTVTKIYIAPINIDLKDALKIAQQIRNLGITTDIDLQGRKLKKNLEYASAQEIKYVAIVGDDEIKARKIMLKDLQSGHQELIAIKDLPEKIK